MATIIPSPNNVSYEQTDEDLNLIRTPTEPIEILLIELGRTLVKDDSFTDWLTMPQITKLCRNRRSRLTLKTYNARRLGELAEHYFDRRQQLVTPGLKVDYMTETTHHNYTGRPINQLLLKFSRFRYHEPVEEAVNQEGKQ